MAVGRWESAIPRGTVANLSFRKALLSECRDAGMRSTVLSMCEEDPVFLYGAFGWVMDPKSRVSVELPLVMPPIQVDMMRAIVESVDDQCDLRIPKSREMAASWTVLLAYWWMWRFRDNQKFLVGSRNESYVDCTGNEKALFQKMDFMHERLPAFLRCRYERTSMRLQNLENGSTINGESTTKDFARGDRRTSLFMDELAAGEAKVMRAALGSTVKVAESRIFASTLSAAPSAFDDVMAMENCREFRAHWSDWPTKRAGLYRGDPRTKEVEILDESYVHPDGYPFVCDGKIRSPYYDWECRRIGDPHTVAVELDIDRAGGNYSFFESGMVAELVREMARPPLQVGELEFRVTERDGWNEIKVEGFRPDPKGRLRVWCRLDNGWPSLEGRNALGADVAAGTGASNTCIAGGNARTGEKVVEFVGHDILPHEAGNYAVALAMWLNKAYLAWEANGPGREFGAMVQRARYSNVYVKRGSVVTGKEVPGFFVNNKDAVTLLYSEYRRALMERRFLNRSADALRECEQIIRHQSGKIAHAKSLGRPDPSGARENHGDRPTADALLWMGMGTGATPQDRNAPPPVGSMMHRRLSAQRAKETAGWER